MSNVQFSHDGRYIIDVSEKRPELISVRAIELQNPTNMKESELSLGAKVTAMKAADHSPRLLVGDAAGNVSIWQLATGERIAGPFETMAPVKALAWNVTEELVAAGGQDGSVWIWEVSTGKERKMSRNFESVVTALVFTRDEKFLIAGCRQGLYWFDTSSGKIQHSRPDIKDTSALAISPNGKFLLQGSHANSAQILDLETGKRVGALLQDRRRVTQVAFSPDSLTAATAGENQSVNVWDVLTGESRGESLEHPASMVGLRFDVNGWLQSGSVTRIAPRWKIPRTTNVDSQRLRTWLETLTTMEITEEGLIQQLTYEKWCKRSKQLHRLGGPPNLFSSVSRESK